MAYARETFTGNGSNRLFSVNFPYISTAHIEVYVAGVLQSPLTFTNATTVQLATAPANGATVQVRRNTPKTTRLVDWQDGTALREADLDLADLQVLYITQEAFDEAESALKENTLGQLDALNKRIVNVAAPVDPTDAVRKAELDAAVLAAGNVPAPGPGGQRFLTSIDATTWQWATLLSVLGYTPADAAALTALLARTVTAGSGLTGGGDLSANRSFAVDSSIVATLANVQAFTGAKRYTPVTLTDAATIAWGLDAAPLARVTLAGNRTVGAPTNQRDGGMFILIVNQDATGGRTLAWNAAFDFGTEGTPSLPTGANKVAIFTFISNGTSMRCIGRWSN